MLSMLSTFEVKSMIPATSSLKSEKTFNSKKSSYKTNRKIGKRLDGYLAIDVRFRIETFRNVI
jgi:hypothetical protein